MILNQALVGFGDEPFAKLGILLADDDVQGELLELADAGETAVAGGQQIGRGKEDVERRPDDVGDAELALRSYGAQPIPLGPLEPHIIVPVTGSQDQPPSREAGGD